jgi:hypothetical protein
MSLSDPHDCDGDHTTRWLLGLQVELALRLHRSAAVDELCVEEPRPTRVDSGYDDDQGAI